MDLIGARRREFSVDEYHRMAEAGIVHEDDNVAGIPEVWIADLMNEKVHVYSRSTDGSYGETRSVGRGDSIVSRTLPSLVVGVEDVLG